MDINKIPKKKAEEKIGFLMEQTICPVCEGPLDIFVELTGPFVVKEEARCGQCRALSRLESHIIH